MKSLGIKRLRFDNDEVVKNINSVIDKIMLELILQLNCHLKFLDLKRFDEERNKLLWVSAWYEVKRNTVSISGLNAFFE